MSAKHTGPSVFVKARQAAFSAIERMFGSYVTWHRRPMRSSSFKRSSFPTPQLPAYAVVLQGPIATSDDFTLETLRIYAKIFPGVPLIVSSWDDTPADVLSALNAEPNVHVVLSPYPAFNGYGNSNYQIASTVAGLRKAQELGAQYAFKTRTDQRIYANDVFPFLYGLIESFPLASTSKQHERIVALGYSTIKYRPYSLNDMFFFGTVDDLLLYWDIPLDTRRIEKARTIGEWAHAKVAEAYFLTSFLKTIGHPIKDTLEDYWQALGTYFILIDPADIDWYWKKYAQRIEEYHYRKYDKFLVGEEVSFKQWLIFARGWSSMERTPKELNNLTNDTHNTPISFS